MNANLKGAAMMVAAMAGFAVEDMLLKSAARDVPVGLILMIFGALGTVWFAALAKSRGDRLLNRDLLHPVVGAKSLAEIVGRLFFVLALALAPLSTVSALLQATPLVVVAGAALFFGERVGWRRWSAIAIGFAGVLIVLRPGVDLGWGSVAALLGMLGFALRDLATRGAPKSLSNMVLGVYGFLALVPAGAIMLAVTGGAGVPPAAALGLIATASVVGTGAYYALTSAMRLGEVAVVTPFRYTRLVFALILAALVFGERPDLLTLLGSAVIVGSGVYTLLRSRRETQTAAAQEI
ncbi:DMT family transporter [Paracoccus shanxieyensis]|uniref:EamA family transporter n=1 Tax=Paracoccus shanxieyensis TaxID=2675752 RepID=A0A6L6IVE8_9RHOB|nr:DMT family transporter [Paracoccus shanxieyensis]MTH64193.1 EamA family transporter [Paracoccus shanxieyensis]MTH87337.1 EamA family transporter [Paracoccus shanxieyensis]